MTRGGGGGEMNILRGDSENFWTPERGSLKKLGGVPKICILQNQQERGGAPKKLKR